MVTHERFVDQLAFLQCETCQFALQVEQETPYIQAEAWKK